MKPDRVSTGRDALVPPARAPSLRAVPGPPRQEKRPQRPRRWVLLAIGLILGAFVVFVNWPPRPESPGPPETRLSPVPALPPTPAPIVPPAPTDTPPAVVAPVAPAPAPRTTGAAPRETPPPSRGTAGTVSPPAPTGPDRPAAAPVESKPAPAVPSLPTSPATGLPLPGIRPTLEPPTAPPAVTAPAAPAPVKDAAAPRRANDSEEINALLEVYEQASDKLDVTAAALLWRRPDMRELDRAFSSLTSQDVTFDRCALAIAEGTATASCQGAVTFVPRVGSPVSRTRKLTWVIELSRTNGRWLIEKVTASETR